jgi:hypothetical protein
MERKKLSYENESLARMEFIFHDSLYSDVLQRHRILSTNVLTQGFFKESFHFILQNVFHYVSAHC